MQYGTKYVNKDFGEIGARIARRNKRALAQFYRAFGKIMFITAALSCRSGIDADEVVNRVMLSVWDNAEYVMKLDSPESWLYNVTKNVSAALARDPEWRSFPYDYPPADEYFRICGGDEFYFLIRALSAPEQEIMIYKYVGKLTFENIAAITRRPRDAVIAAFSASFAKVKTRIEKKLKKI